MASGSCSVFRRISKVFLLVGLCRSVRGMFGNRRFYQRDVEARFVCVHLLSGVLYGFIRI